MSSFYNLDKAKCLDKLVLNFYKNDLKFSLSEDEIQLFDWDMQQSFLELTVNSERLKKYPGNREFTRLFFKKLIDYLQDSLLGQDTHDGFYTALCASVVKDKDSESSFYYRHYVIGNDLDLVITMKETSNLVANGTTGLRTWEAARMLADWALSNKEEFTNKNVLELGSGVGFTGITIAKLCNTQSMMLTDCHPDVLKTIEKNIKINFPDEQSPCDVMHLNWNSCNKFPENIVPDVIIGADIVYDPSIMEPLCKVFQHFFNKNTELTIYVQSVVRNQKTFEKFYYMLGSLNFNVEKLTQAESTFVDWDRKTERSLLKITTYL